MAPRSANPTMNLADLIHDRRDLLVDRWFDAVAQTYPADTARFLKDNADQFHNPVGHTLRRCLPVLFDTLVGRAGSNELSEALADIVRIRAVQCNAPSQAVAFVYLLKNIAREQMSGNLAGQDAVAQLLDFESRVDGLALTMFDEYMNCREKICDIRVLEAKRRSAKLVEQVNKLYGKGDQDESISVTGKSNAGNI